MSLLNQLRRGQLVPVNHPYRINRKQARNVMNLIIEHKSEFPIKLRPAITIAASKCRPGIFVSEVYIAVTYFFFGRYHKLEDAQELDDKNSADEWHGLDSKIDTEDQVELVIRLFPWILQEEFLGMPSSRGHIPIFFVASCPKSVSFVPLFAKLGADLGVFGSKQDSAGLAWSGDSGSTLKQLFVHTLTTIDSGKEPSDEFDKESLLMLSRLREMGFCSKRDEHDLMWWLFNAAKHRKIDFIESRLRLLVTWNPTILESFSSQRTNLLRNFLYYFKERNSYHESYALSLFRLILELGMSHFSPELGFAFHKTCLASRAILWLPECEHGIDTNFGLACHMFGTETVTKSLNDIVSSTIQTNFSTTGSALRSLVIAASSNRHISLEGVYTLLRRDPMAILPP